MKDFKHVGKQSVTVRVIDSYVSQIRVQVPAQQFRQLYSESYSLSLIFLTN
jgi:hypothetical protein